MQQSTMDEHAAPYATFSGMHTERDSDDDDELLQELPIYLTQQLTQQLLVIQQTLRPCGRPYEFDVGACTSVRVKPIQKKLEMEFNILKHKQQQQHAYDNNDESANYDESHAHPIHRFHYTARALPPKTNYCVGVLRDGGVHLCPIHAILPLKPNLGYIDEAQLEMNEEAEKKKQAHRMERKENGLLTEEEMAEMEAEEEEKAAQAAKQNELQTVLMKVKKKEQQAGSSATGATGPGGANSSSLTHLLGVSLRKQSYSFLKQLEDHEQWLNLSLHDQHSDKAQQQFQLLLAHAQHHHHHQQPITHIPFNVPAHQYLQYVNPTDLMDGSSTGPSMCAAGDDHLALSERILHLLRIARVISFRDLCVRLAVRTTSVLDECLLHVSVMCWVIQGNLVLKSSILHDRSWRPGQHVRATNTNAHTHINNKREEAQDRAEFAREYLLTLFHRQRVVNRSTLMPIVKLDLEHFDEILNELARPITAHQQLNTAQGVMWEFTLDTDQQFINSFSRVCALTDSQMVQLEQDLFRHLTTRYTYTNPKHSFTSHLPARVHCNTADILHNTPVSRNQHTHDSEIPRVDSSSTPSPPVSSAHVSSVSLSYVPITGSPHTVSLLSRERSARDQCTHFIRLLFDKYGVIHTTFLQEQLAIQKNNQHIANNELILIQAPQLQEIVHQEALYFGPHNDLLVRKSKNNPSLDAYRHLIARLFSAALELRKADIRNAIEQSNNQVMEVPDKLYREIMNEFAHFEAGKGIWTLKTGKYTT